MGALMSHYDPFSVYGQYNLKEYSYKNKKNVITVLVMILIIILGSIVMLYTTDPGVSPSIRPKFNIPPPKYGYGPYGQGLYLPPTEMLAGVIKNS